MSLVERLVGRGVGSLAVLLMLASPARPGEPDAVLSFGSLGHVRVYAPAGEPEQVVLFLSGDGGWNRGVVPMAEELRGQGALVAGLSTPHFLYGLAQGGASCSYPAGSLEEISRSVELRRHLASYLRPILVGYSSGATLAYWAIAAAPPETFAGALSLGFCPDLKLAKPPCAARSLSFARPGRAFVFAPDPRLAVPWQVLQGESDQVCPPEATRRFVEKVPGAVLVPLPRVGHGFGVPRNWRPQYLEAYRTLARRSAAPPPSLPEVADLPLAEVPAEPQSPHRRLMAVLFTGDGGWAELDKSVARNLAAQGVPVVGWSSLRYFWTPRTPGQAAADLVRVVDHYGEAWSRPEVVLIGYSFGADVLPFLAARLPRATRAKVRSLVLLGLSEHASFEFHVSGWLGGDGDARFPTRPEIARLRLPVLCMMGDEETDSACQGLPAKQVVKIQGGHHFGGDYARLARSILDHVAAEGP